VTHYLNIESQYLHQVLTALQWWTVRLAAFVPLQVLWLKLEQRHFPTRPSLLAPLMPSRIPQPLLEQLLLPLLLWFLLLSRLP
jgi:hypothetical protein